MTVSEAAHDEVIEPGHVYIAPGAYHLQLGRRNGKRVCHVVRNDIGDQSLRLLWLDANDGDRVPDSFMLQ